VHDAERIGDHAMNLAELADGLMEANVKFSGPAEKALLDLFNTVDESCQLVSKALQDYNVNLALKMYELEDKIDFMAYEIRESHVARLKANECKPENGIYFLDMASNLERIGDHCLNIAQVVIGDNEKRIEHDGDIS
jgi:phosphate:Na+ symporter